MPKPPPAPSSPKPAVSGPAERMRAKLDRALEEAQAARAAASAGEIADDVSNEADAQGRHIAALLDGLTAGLERATVADLVDDTPRRRALGEAALRTIEALRAIFAELEALATRRGAAALEAFRTQHAPQFTTAIEQLQRASAPLQPKPEPSP